MKTAKKASRSKRGGARAGAGRPRAVETDDAILEASLALVEKRGYVGLNIDDVAAAAGVAKTTIYRRWRSKACLIDAAVEPILKATLDVPDTGSLRQDLLLMLEGIRALLSGRSGRILQILIHESSGHPELNESVQSALYRRRKNYYQVLNRAVARGEMRPDIDHELVSDLLLGPFLGRALITRSQMPAEMVPQVVDTVLGGIAHEPAARDAN